MYVLDSPEYYEDYNGFKHFARFVEDIIAQGGSVADFVKQRDNGEIMDDTSHRQVIQSEDEFAHMLKSAVELEASFEMSANFESYTSHVTDGKSPKVAGDVSVAGGTIPKHLPTCWRGLTARQPKS